MAASLKRLGIAQKCQVAGCPCAGSTPRGQQGFQQGSGAAEQPPSADKPQREPIRWWWTLSKDGRLSLAILSQLRLTTCCVPCQSLARLAVPVRFLGCTRTFMICTLNSCLVS